MVKTFESLVLSKYWTLTGKLFSLLLVSILITGEARADSAPVAQPDTETTPEDTPVNIDVLANDTDADNDTLSILTAVMSGAGTGSVTTDGSTITYTPPLNYNGTATVFYFAADDADGADSTSVTITVTSVNDAPVAVDDTGTMTEDDSATSFTVLSNDTDTEGDTLTVSSPTISSGDTTGTVTTDGTTVTYTPSGDFNGTTVIDYTITDDGTTNGSNDFLTDTGTLTITVSEVNDAPIANDVTATIAEDAAQQTYPVTLSSIYASDADSDTLTITSAALAGDVSGSIDFSDGINLLYTPGPDFNGVATLTYTVTDNGTTGGSNDFLTDSGSILVTVTPVADSPVIDTTPATYSGTEITEDAANITITLIDSASLVDVDGERLQLFSINLDNGGNYVINYDSNGAWDGTVTYTPAANFAGNEVFSYAVTDGVEVVNLSLTVPVAIGTNDAPVANADTQTVSEDTQTATQIAVLSNDTDAEGDSLTVTGVVIASTTPEFGTGPGTVTTDGTYVSYTPAAGFVGTETITYTITDDGTSNAISDPLTASGTLTVTVTNVNDPPVVVDPESDTTPEGIAITVPVGTDANYVTDPEGDTIVVDTVSIASGDASGTVSIDGTTGITYTPSANFNGTVVIDYQVSDDGTTNAAADPLTATGTLTITVTADAVNSAPVASGDTQTVIEDSTTISIDVLANDSDVDASDSLTVTAVSTTGIGLVSTDGSLVYYTPAANFTGTETITYTVQDDDSANGGASPLTDTAELVIRVLAQDDPPAQSAVTVPVVSANSPTVTITLFDSLVDTTDGDAITIAIIGGDSEGTIVNNGDGTISYTPLAGFVGDEVVSYTVTDSTGQVTTASITITVNTNAAPVVDSTASSTVVENSQANPIDIISKISDADAGDTLVISSISANKGGSVAVGADGTSVTYTPLTEFFGDEVLTFEVSDGTNTVTGFHTVVVTENDTTAPSIDASFPTTYVAGISNQITINVIGATDAKGSAYVVDDSSTLYVRIVGRPQYGSVSTDGRNIYYTSYGTALSTVDDSITFEIFDGVNVSNTITIVINLVPANTGTCDPAAVSLDDPTLADGCTITPTGYRIPVHLFGLCTSNPAAPTSASAYDLSNCSFFFDGRATNESSTISFGGINETTAYSGAISVPDFGTYTHGVILVGTDVEMKGSLYLPGSSTPYCVTGDYTDNIQCFSTDVDEAFVDNDPISYLYESGVYSYEFSSENVSVYLVDDSGQSITIDGAGTKILAVQEFATLQSFSDATTSINIELGISDSLILNNGTAKAAPFVVNFTVQ